MDYDELAAADTEGRINSYGFDVGQWSRLVGRVGRNHDCKVDVESMSELAVGDFQNTILPVSMLIYADLYQ